MDSVIYKDVAYQADPGYIAEKNAPVPPQGSKPAIAAGTPAAKPADQPVHAVESPGDRASEADQLSKFILDNLL